MNCDQVFAVLTRGPFPTGAASDMDVETHLARCAACRRLAEALRPALEVFQESVPVEESKDLPGYWSEIIPAPAVASPHVSLTQLARVPTELHKRLVAKRLWMPSGGDGNGWRIAMAVLLGVALGMVLRATDVWHRSSRGSAVVAPKAANDSDRPFPTIYVSGDGIDGCFPFESGTSPSVNANSGSENGS